MQFLKQDQIFLLINSFISFAYISKCSKTEFDATEDKYL